MLMCGLLIILSFSGVVAMDSALLEPSTKSENVADIALAVYASLQMQASRIVKGSPAVVQCYNDLCSQWRMVLSAVGEAPPFVPLVCQERVKEAPIGVPLLDKAALDLFLQWDRLQPLRAWADLNSLDLPTGCFDQLRVVIFDNIPHSDALQKACKMSQEPDWVCPDILACAAATVSGSILKALMLADAALAIFLHRCQQDYVSKAHECLALFKPLGFFITQSDTRVCNAIKKVRSTVRYLKSTWKEEDIVWNDLPVINDVEDFAAGLQELGENFKKHKNGMAFVQFFQNCCVDNIWQELVIFSVEKAGLMGRIPAIAAAVDAMEAVYLPEPYITSYCLEYGVFLKRKKCEDLNVQGLENKTFVRFFQGQNASFFMYNLLEYEKERPPLEGADCRQEAYMQLLEWSGDPDWWGVLIGLLRGGCEYDGVGYNRLWKVWNKILESDIDCCGVLQHLCDLERVVPRYAEKSAQKVCCQLLERLGQYRIWCDKSGFKNVNLVVMSAIVDRLHTACVSNRKCFFSFVRQCLPTKEVWLQRGGALSAIPSTSWFKKVLTGGDVLGVMTEMAQAEGVWGGLVSSYVHHLSLDLDGKQWLQILQETRGLPQYGSLFCRFIWDDIKAQGWRNKEDLFAHLKFLVSLESEHKHYANRELSELCDYIKSVGLQKPAYAFLQCGSQYAACFENKELYSRAKSLVKPPLWFFVSGRVMDQVRAQYARLWEGSSEGAAVEQSELGHVQTPQGYAVRV